MITKSGLRLGRAPDKTNSEERRPKITRKTPDLVAFHYQSCLVATFPFFISLFSMFLRSWRNHTIAPCQAECRIAVFFSLVYHKQTRDAERRAVSGNEILYKSSGCNGNTDSTTLRRLSVPVEGATSAVTANRIPGDDTALEAFFSRFPTPPDLNMASSRQGQLEAMSDEAAYCIAS